MRSAAAAPPVGASFSSPLHLLWSRMSRPFNLVRALPALCGIPSSHVADLITLHLALTAEAEHLIEAGPELIRSLTSTTTITPKRTIGAVTGAVLWGETLTARANGLGGEDVFVCGAPERDHDTPENQVFAASLGLIVRAGRRLETPAALESLRVDQRAVVADRSSRANRLLSHYHLAPLRNTRPTPRAITSARQSRNAPHFAAALEMWSRRHDPIHPDELLSCTDAITRGQQRALALVMLALQRRGIVVPQLRVKGHELIAGDLRYRNWHHATPSGGHGIVLRRLLVDGAPDSTTAARSRALAQLERRAGDRMFCLVTSEAEAEMAVELAYAQRSARLTR